MLLMIDNLAHGKVFLLLSDYRAVLVGDYPQPPSLGRFRDRSPKYQTCVNNVRFRHTHVLRQRCRGEHVLKVVSKTPSEKWFISSSSDTLDAHGRAFGCQFRKTNARRQKWTALIAFHGCAEVEINVRLEELAGLSGIWSMPLPTCLRADWNL